MREIYINSIQFSGRRVTSLINIGGYNETIETTINCSFGVDVVADRIDAFCLWFIVLCNERWL